MAHRRDYSNYKLKGHDDDGNLVTHSVKAWAKIKGMTPEAIYSRHRKHKNKYTEIEIVDCPPGVKLSDYRHGMGMAISAQRQQQLFNKFLSINPKAFA